MALLFICFNCHSEDSVFVNETGATIKGTINKIIRSQIFLLTPSQGFRSVAMTSLLHSETRHEMRFSR